MSYKDGTKGEVRWASPEMFTRKGNWLPKSNQMRSLLGQLMITGLSIGHLGA